MSNYINKYLNQSAYDADSTKQYPNTSLVGTEIVFKMEDTFDGIIATFNVTSTSEATKLLERTGNVSKVWIDGVEQTEVIRSYQFSTTGEHEVKYELIDPTTTGNDAFRNCSSLTTVTIPNSVTSIGYNAFSGCSSLTSVTIGSGVTSIDGSAFQSCSGLTNIVVDSANTVYDSRNNCNAIINTSTNELILGCKNTVIPNTVTSIGQQAFYNCTGLTSITIPDSVTSIGQYAFRECRGLTNITIPNSVTSIGDWAFQNCRGLTNITIPNSVTSIGNSTFRDCYGLTSITIPNSVTSIGEYAFINCSSLTSITIPNSVTSIGNNAFNTCAGLTSVTIPDSVTIIDAYAFANCYGLTSVTIQATTPPTLGSSAFAYNGSGRKIYVPAESVETYKTATNWSAYADRIVEIPSE